MCACVRGGSPTGRCRPLLFRRCGAQARAAELGELLKAEQSKSAQRQDRIQEQEGALNVLKAEFAQRHTERETLREKVEQLEKENKLLIQRFIDYKNMEAERMNEITDMYEHARRKSTIDESKAALADMDPAALVPTGSGSPLDGVMGRMMLHYNVDPPSGPKHTIVAHSADVQCVSFNSTGTMIATGSDDKYVKLWDARTGAAIASLSGSVGSIMAVDFSGDGQFVLGASGQNACLLWRIKAGRLCSTLTGHLGKVSTARFATDSQRIVSGSQDRTLKVWNVANGTCIKTMFCPSSCNDVIVGSDGNTAISGHLDHGLRFWDLRTGDEAYTLTGLHGGGSGGITSVSQHPMEPALVLTSSRDNTLQLVDIRTYAAVRTYKHAEYRSGVNWNRACFSPDGQFVVSGSDSGPVYLWRTDTAKSLAPLSGHRMCVTAASWGLNGQLATCDRDKCLVIWE